MRWAMRGLEACVALPPSENHLRGDFKNIPIMLQDKSLITGNYGLPISPPTLCLTLTTLILSFNRRSSLGERSRDGAGGGEGAITWEQTLIMAADALLHFHSCGVVHLWAAITDQIGHGSKLGLVMKYLDWLWLAALFFFACVHSMACMLLNSVELLDAWICMCIHGVDYRYPEKWLRFVFDRKPRLKNQHYVVVFYMVNTFFSKSCHIILMCLIC